MSIRPDTSKVPFVTESPICTWGMPVRVIKFVMIPSVEAIRSAGKESV